MNFPAPINFEQWIDDHRKFLKPPVCNKQVFDHGDYIVMVVGGPNGRPDYHINQTGELFYQLEGEMVLKIRNEKGEFEDIPIKKGEMLLLPPKVPHSPQRMENSVGLVVEKKRRDDEIDSLVWYCDNCHHTLHTASFHLTNIEKQIKEGIESFWANEAVQTCSQCGTKKEK
jgi:3-hydroxyanthranilate 3,4-dioxygenase